MPAEVAATVVTARLVNDPAVVHHGLRFHWRYPAAHGELADGTAQQRLASGRLAWWT
ncbi:hypothetical protein [Jiangella endophytica]|uniref:hypothetical protein n=1 Tax=Jiangella endophytica TaxID=1623398 RepID=UPI0013006C7A|nr:hypothetical protein [Jiangella endophytica]